MTELLYVHQGLVVARVKNENTEGRGHGITYTVHQIFFV